MKPKRIIDIASHQAGMNLENLFQKNPDLDGVIVKTSGGNWYSNPYASAWLDWLRANGKMWGFYHYLDEDNCNATPAQEVEWFLKNSQGFWGEGTAWIDYEAGALAKGPAYVKEILDRLYDATGVKPGIYCSLSVVKYQDFSAIADAGYPFWMAQYADTKTVHFGFDDEPWQHGSPLPFSKFWLHQYTSLGRLNGWHTYERAGNLDFELFYGDRADWDRLAGISAEPDPEPLKPADPEVVNAVLRGEYGNGTARAGNLESAGYDAENVQAKVNELYAIALSCHNFTRGNEDYLNSILYILRNL